MFQGMEPLEVILSKVSSPYAFRTQLEWYIVGLVDETVYSATVLCSKISVQDMSCKTVVSHYFAMETEVKDVGIRQMLHRIYAADFIDHCSSKKIEDFHSYFFMFSKTSSLLVETPLKMMENAFYFILKALFILNVFQFLIWLFVHVDGLIRKIRLVSKFMASEPVW